MIGLSGSKLGPFSAVRARQLAAGATETGAAFRAVGLQSSLSLVVPLGILITGVALWLAARYFVADAARVSTDAAAAPR